MLIHATSPIRRSGSTLSPIPNEIYIHILGYLKPLGFNRWQERMTKRSLSNVALVCRLFSVIVQPWAFEHLRFDAEEEDPGVPDGFRTQSHVTFCRSILDGEPTARTMAQHVKKCTLDLRDAVPHPYFEGILSLYSSAMRHMPNIQELLFTEIKLTKELVKAIVSLRQLTSLKLEDCMLTEDVKEGDLQRFSSLEFKYIDVGFRYRDHVHSILPEDLALTLKPLSLVNVNSALQVSTSHPRLIQLLADAKCDLPLESLEFRMLDADTVQLLSRISLRTPFLKSLRILDEDYPMQHSSYSHVHIPKDALPVLEDVAIPLELCQDVIPGRPITSVRLIHSYMPSLGEWLESKLYWLRRAPFPGYTCPLPYYHRFKLGIEQVNINQTILNTIGTWPVYPPLNSMVFDFESRWSALGYTSFNLAEQHDWVSRIIFPIIPTLRRCQFNRYFEWFYSECDSSWNPTVIPSQELAAVDFLQITKYVDYGNCLTKLLASS